MSKRTEISELGEFGLIDRITKNFFNQSSQTHYGVGDDAAVLQSGEQQMLVSTDLLIEGVHFDLTYMPLKHLGYKAAVVNFSDICAMNAVPGQILVSLGLSNRFSVEAVEEIYAGIHEACKNYKVDLVGGDISASHSGLTISVTAIGYASEEKITYRKGAQLEDVICVTGDLGGAFMGLHVLEREKQEFKANPDMQPDLSEKDYVIQRQLRPEARADFIHSLKEIGVKPTSMIDISDGLASELFHLHFQSKMGMKIYEDKLPVDEQTRETSLEFNIDPTTSVLNGGEDYELLFTVSLEDFEKLKNHPDVTSIGYVTEYTEGVKMVFRSGNLRDIEAQGWQHFKPGS
jgi:thiamine-monophosphate kinase